MCTDGANTEESAVQELYGCWHDLFTWVWSAYDLTDDSWDGAGLLDACNTRLPFTKVINAAYLIGYTLSDNYALQWHSAEDYESLARAADNRFHGSFYIRLTQDRGAEANAETGRFLAEDRTSLHCTVFDLGNGSDSASNRASVLVHEAWHHWQHAHGYKTDHQNCGGRDCDWFYWHTVSEFDFGQLNRYDLHDPAHPLFHSPYQIQCEFDADFAELSHDWVPLVATQAARARQCPASKPIQERSTMENR